MKNKLKPNFVPKWARSMFKIMHKYNGVWVHWERPDPTTDPNITNHQRMLNRKEERATLKS